MAITFVAESDFEHIKEANKHLKDNEGMVFVKAVLFKKDSDAGSTLGGARGVFMIGERAELKAELLRLFEDTFSKYDEIMKGAKKQNEERY